MQKLKEKIFHFSFLLLRNAATLFLFTFLFRVAEVIALAAKGLLPHGFILNTILGVAGDGAAICYYSVIIFLPAFVIFLLSEVAAKAFLKILFILLALIQLLLTVYFIISGILLDDALYNYSLADIKFIIGTTGVSFSTVILSVLLTTGIIYYAWSKISRHILINKSRNKWFVPLALLITILHQQVIHLSINGDFGLSMQVNKSFYLFNRTTRYFSKSKDHLSSSQLKAEAGVYHKHSNKDFLSTEYPLLAKNDFPDVLSPFFNIHKSPPNIVFIIVEGLAKCFSGPNAEYQSFTPFIDSLSQHSLYFPNFLSTAERTFGILPSLLGSLPYGQKGFLNEQRKGKYPRHFSLLKILGANGYYTTFHYGGWAHFTGYDDFMYEQHADYMSNERVKSGENKFSWGLQDDGLFNQSFRITDSLHNPQPRADVFLTVSMHNPFNFPNREFYSREFDKRVSSMPISQQRKEEISKYKELLTPVLYTDGALKDFFKQYSARTEFANTIFIITGDHAMPEIAMNGGYLNCYLTELLIYSPMLKSGKTIESVSSHLDVVPSLLSLLKNNYGLNAPAAVHWLGDGLDTCSTFRNVHSLAFKHGNMETADYISGNYFLNGNRLYNISSGLENSRQVSNDALLSQLKNELTNFKTINEYVCSENRIVDAQNYSWFDGIVFVFTLPLHSEFRFSQKDDTLMYVTENFSLPDSLSSVSFRYLFNYSRSDASMPNVSIVFEVKDKRNGKILSQQSAEPSGIFKFDLKETTTPILTVYFIRKPSSTGSIDNTRIDVRYTVR